MLYFLAEVDPDPKSCSIQKRNSDLIHIPLNEGGVDKKSGFTEEPVVFPLKQAEPGMTSVAEVCHKLGLSDATFCI